MKKVKVFVEWIGWELLFFAIAAIIGISLIIKTVADFLNNSVQPHIHFKLSPTDLGNALTACLLTHCIYTAHKHLSRKRKSRMLKKSKVL